MAPGPRSAILVGANRARNESSGRTEMQTAFSITNVSFSADPVAPNIVDLVVEFQIFNNGPSHVAGLVVTTDFWITSQIAPAAFQRFGAGFEFWRAVPNPRTTGDL
jgi:hypothetical protein